MRAEPPPQTMVTLQHYTMLQILKRYRSIKNQNFCEFRLQITQTSLRDRGMRLITLHRQFTFDEHRFIIARTLDGTQDK
jgi:hypothetical protein